MMTRSNAMNGRQYTQSQAKIPPQALDFEDAVLGACLVESEAFDKIAMMLDDSDFYDTRNQAVYRAMRRLHDARSPIDMLTVTKAVMEAEKNDDVAWPVHISGLSAKIGSAAHIETHASVVKERSIQRKCIRLANEIENAVYENEDVGEILNRAISGNELLLGNLIGESNGAHFSEAIKGAIEAMYARVELARKNVRSGIETGLNGLDKMTNGWQPGNLIIVASRPSMGKTAFLLHMAKAAAKSGAHVAIFSLEMSDISLANRLLLAESGVDSWRFKTGRMSNEDMENIEKAANALWNLPIYVDDNPCVSMEYVRSRSKIMRRRGECDIVMMDYLQLADSGGSKELNREREVAKMSRLAKITAKELKIPFILLSQLNRGNETRLDKKPLLSDLRESGAIEQDADIVMFIHRPGYYKIEVRDKRGNVEQNYGELIIAKNRDGATGTVPFKHNDGMNRFYDYGIDNEMPF